MLTRVVPTNSHSAGPGLLPSPPSDDDWFPTLAAGDATSLKALYRHRRPIEASVLGHRIAIETAARVTAEPDAYAFRLALAGRRALLRVSANLVDLCARSLAVACFDRLSAQQAGMVLELALLPSIKTFEARLRAEIRVEERIEAIEGAETFVPLRLRVRGAPGRDGAIELFVDRQSATAIATALDEFAVPNSSTEQLPILVRICVAGVDLTLAELRTLRPGDVILPDRDPKQPIAIVAVVGERVPFQTERVAGGLRIVSRLAGARADSAGVWSMQQSTEAMQQSVEEAGLEQLPIRVVFEIGRLEMPLAEVRRLAPGYVLPLAKPSETAVDIVANGRKIGHGSLLKIGDSIGVRVERLLSDD